MRQHNEAVLERFNKESEKKYVIVDLDGTLALNEHRRHLVEISIAMNAWHATLSEQDKIDLLGWSNDELKRYFVNQTAWKPKWNEFFDECDKDLPNKPLIQLIDYLSSHCQIFVMSGRSDRVKDKTLKWLEDHKVYFEFIIMREEGDYTPDEQLKALWVERNGFTPENVLCVFDDRQKVVDMWRSKGFSCFQVAPGDF